MPEKERDSILWNCFPIAILFGTMIYAFPIWESLTDRRKARRQGGERLRWYEWIFAIPLYLYIILIVVGGIVLAGFLGYTLLQQFGVP